MSDERSDKGWRTKCLNAQKELSAAHVKLNAAYEQQVEMEEEIASLRAGGAGAPADSRSGQACEWGAAGTPSLRAVR